MDDTFGLTTKRKRKLLAGALACNGKAKPTVVAFTGTTL